MSQKDIPPSTITVHRNKDGRFILSSDILQTDQSNMDQASDKFLRSLVIQTCRMKDPVVDLNTLTVPDGIADTVSDFNNLLEAEKVCQETQGEVDIQ